jgi:PAS domain S-box-containing protein
MAHLLQDTKHFDYISLGEDKMGRPLIAQLKENISSYNSLVKQLLNYDKKNFSDAKKLLNVTIVPYYNSTLLPLVKSFRNQIRADQEQQVAFLNHQLDIYGHILAIVTLVAFVFSLLLAYLLYKSITNPLYLLAKGAEEIGQGNLEERIEINGNDEIGMLGRSFNRMAENLSKITFSKEYVDDIIESMGDALIVTDEQAAITRVNSTTLNLLGYRPKELNNQPVNIIFGEDNAELLSTESYATFKNYETQFKQRNGEIFPVSLSKAMIHNNDGTVQGLVFVASDISERRESERMIKKSLAEKEVLLAEIHHRVKNNLAVISGLLQMQQWQTEQQSARDVLQDSQLRVKSIALIHEKLYQTENLADIAFDQYVNDLIKEINQTFSNAEKNIIFDIDVEPITFSLDQAITCSLLLNELVVNAHKHAFKELKQGKVTVKLWKEGQQGVLIVKDNGQGLPLNNEKKTLGMTLISTLVKQLEGELEAYNEDGAVFKISFELEQS